MIFYFIYNILFSPDGDAADKNECRRCVKALQELENVDDDADQLGIAMVKINDPDLADEYSLGSLPSLVYYRKRIPVVFDGECKVLWVVVLHLYLCLSSMVCSVP